MLADSGEADVKAAEPDRLGQLYEATPDDRWTGVY